MIERKTLEFVLTYLPEKISGAVSAYLDRSGISEGDISEIRLRAFGVVAVTVRGRNVALDAIADTQDLKYSFRKICDGAIYAHRDDVCRGFVTLPFGVRVGICGYARYEREELIGIGDVSSLAFRIPSGKCSFVSDLYRAWCKIGGGMLICSPAGAGKTTAIRSLAHLMGSGNDAKRVVVVDERCEFLPEAYRGAHVDILRGYKRSLGVDIAIRSMSAEVVVVDEISSLEEARALILGIGSGATIVATTHATSLSAAMRRSYISELISAGAFESACVISRSGNVFSFSLERINDELKSVHGMGDICLI